MASCNKEAIVGSSALYYCTFFQRPDFVLSNIDVILIKLFKLKVELPHAILKIAALRIVPILDQIQQEV